MLVKDYDYDNANMIERIIRGKFVRENLTGNTQKIQVCTAFADNIMGLIDAISMEAIDSDEYIQNTFRSDEFLWNFIEAEKESKQYSSVVRNSPILLSNLTHIGYVNILMDANLLLTFF